MVDEALPIRRLTEAGMTTGELAKLENTWREYPDNRKQIVKFFAKLALEDIIEWLEVQRVVGHFSTTYDPVTDPVQVGLDEGLALSSFIPLTQKGASEGVATLNSKEELAASQVPVSVVSGSSIPAATSGQVPVSNGEGSWTPETIAGLGNALLFVAQALTSSQKVQARSNIDFLLTLAAAIDSTVRTNLATNPGLEAAETNWVNFAGTGGALTASRVTDATLGHAYELTWTTEPTGVGGGGFGSTTAGIAVVPGQPFAASLGACPSIAQQMCVLVKFYKSSGVQVGSTLFGPSRTIAAGEYVTLLAPASTQVPAEAAFATVQATPTGGGAVLWPVGATLLLGQCMVEAAAAVGPWFDGDSQTGSWTGTAHASTSQGVLQQFAPLSQPNFTGAVVPSWNGSALATFSQANSFNSSAMHNKLGWVTATAFNVWDLVYVEGNLWFECISAHISGTFLTDWQAGKWRLISNGTKNLSEPPRAISDYASARLAAVSAALHPLPPTVSYLASGFSLSSILGSTYVEHVYSEGGLPVRKVGVVTSTVSEGGVNCERNVAVGSSYAGGASGPSPYSLEFILSVPKTADGTIVLSHVPQVISGGPGVGVWVEIDGRPATWAMQRDSAPVSGSLRGIEITGLPTGTHLIRLTCQQIDWHSISVTGNAQIAASTSTRKTVYILGDSWIAGGGSTNAHPTWPHSIAPLLAKLLDADTAFGGQGSTGYCVNPGSPASVFGSTDRLNAITAYAPNYLLVFGSENDDTSASSVQAAATALYSAIATALPACKIMVVAPQSTIASTQGNRVTSTNGVQAAAEAASNVVGATAIKPIGSSALPSQAWMSGNGHLGAADSLGASDSYMWTDGLHTTVFGDHYYARRIFEGIVELFDTAGLIGVDGFSL
jgi:lysophospholipase L1-like esterase